MTFGLHSVYLTALPWVYRLSPPIRLCGRLDLSPPLNRGATLAYLKWKPGTQASVSLVSNVSNDCLSSLGGWLSRRPRAMSQQDCSTSQTQTASGPGHFIDPLRAHLPPSLFPLWSIETVGSVGQEHPPQCGCTSIQHTGALTSAGACIPRPGVHNNS